MNVRLPDGTIIQNVPEGTTQDELLERVGLFRAQQAQAQATIPPAPPSTGAVALNAAAKGLASLPDMFLNAPQNLVNLAKAGYGAAAGILGRPDIPANMDIAPPPNVVQQGLQQIGAINPANEPQTATQRILDTAIQGGVGMAINPASGIRQVAQNVGTGLASGLAAGATKEATGSPLAAMAAGALAPAALQGARALATNALPTAPSVREQTLSAAQKEGYVVPPSTVKPSMVNKALESFAGKAATGQEAAVRNQVVTNKLVAQELGLPSGTEITESVLTAFRKEHGKAYQAVAALDPEAARALDGLKYARHQSSLQWNFFNRSGNPDALIQASKFDAMANRLEDMLEKTAATAGKPELVQDLAVARTAIAKSYDVEKALNVGDANVSAAIIGRLLDKGKPLTGNLETIGRFAQAFPRATREAASVPSAGVSALNPIASLILGGGAYGLGGGPGGALAGAALPWLRGGVRSAILFQPYQRYVMPGQLTSRLAAQIPIRSPSETAIQSVLSSRAVAQPVYGP